MLVLDVGERLVGGRKIVGTGRLGCVRTCVQHPAPCRQNGGWEIGLAACHIRNAIVPTVEAIDNYWRPLSPSNTTLFLLHDPKLILMRRRCRRLHNVRTIIGHRVLQVVLLLQRVRNAQRKLGS